MLDVNKSLELIDERQIAKLKTTKPAARRGKDGKVDGLRVDSLLSGGTDPFAQIEWERRRASIQDDKGKVIFVQDNVEMPKSWSQLATNVVTSKYFYGAPGTNQREYSVRQLVHRVARTIADWGLRDGYFASAADADNFYHELSFICVNQYGSFNSPVWFNVGLHQEYGLSSNNHACYHWNAEAGQIEPSKDSYKYPQASACFIQSVQDTMEDIMRLASAEAMLFKYGSGTGTDLSTLRSSREKLSGGGTPSGPLSFMRVYDQVAAVVKSGGKTRRAAKMQSLKVTHPDILDFITCKTKEEKKAWTLIDAGYDGSFGGDAYSSIMFQNANLSVRLTDEFMKAVEEDGEWQTRAVTNGEVKDTYKAREIIRHIAEGTHICGDPGVQYDTTVNRWHTCINSGRINASNPCSEFMFVDDSACNLASINLMKLMDEAGNFDIDRFRHIVRIFIIAQEIIVDSASYPVPTIALNSHLFRPLGLGFANLGAVILSLGQPYDSDPGRAFAGAVTSLMTGFAYETSAELARIKGPFDEYRKNAECMAKVMHMHREAVDHVDRAACPPALIDAAEAAWDRAIAAGERNGYRNSQVTLLAPTGTIGFMMDCDTTGVEPDIALVKYKQLAGGGMMKIVNRTVGNALRRLGYAPDAVGRILKHIDDTDTIEGAADLKPEDLPVFDCAFKPKNGVRSIPHQAHLRMMAAVQPFLSGAISKTINMPTEATVDEIMQAYIDGWKMGLKAIAIYRDGSKRTQPLNTSKVEQKDGSEPAADSPASPAVAAAPKPFRRRMSATRNSITHKFEVAGHEGYLTVGLYEDGAPGELFITMAKEGSTVGGTMDSFGTAISLCLQYGVPLKELVRKFSHSRFEPSGFTKNPDIPMAKSLVDYIFRWMDLTFPDGRVASQHEAPPPKQSKKPHKARHAAAPAASGAAAATAPAAAEAAAVAAPASAAATGTEEGRFDEQFESFEEDAPACDVCGMITVRNGHCYRCYNCGNSMGCS